MSALPRGPPAKRGKSHQMLQKYYRIITKVLNLAIESVLHLQLLFNLEFFSKTWKIAQKRVKKHVFIKKGGLKNLIKSDIKITLYHYSFLYSLIIHRTYR